MAKYTVILKVISKVGIWKVGIFIYVELIITDCHYSKLCYIFIVLLNIRILFQYQWLVIYY